jgi:hypothetical protein
MEAVNTSPVQRFLTATDLDELAERRAEIGDGLTADDLLEIEAVLHDWEDVQAIANLLMYPQLIAAADRVATLRRAFDDDRSYLQLAATVGLGDVDQSEFSDEVRYEIVQALLDIIASDAGTRADRASFAVAWLIRPVDGPETAECLGHPSKTVRHNLTQGLLRVLDSAGVAALLDEPGFVPPETQRIAREHLTADGIDLSLSAEDNRRPLILAYLPNYSDWTD